MNSYSPLALLALVVLLAPRPMDARPPQSEPEPDVPEAVREAERQGRHWRAARLLDAHLEAATDTTPQVILLAARLSAGWGDWSSVSRLLDGREWLDSAGAGEGWLLLGRARLRLGRPAEAETALGRYLAVARPGARDAAVVDLQRGLALAEADRPAAALDALDRAAERIPWFADWAALLSAEVAAEAGDTAAVRERLARAGPELVGERAWRLRLRAAEAAGDSMAAREVALARAGEAASASDQAVAWAILGDLRLAAGDTARAVEAYRVATETPASAGAVSAARALTELAPGPAEWRTIGQIYFRHGNARRAIEGFENYLAGAAADAADRTSIRLDLGEAYFNAGRYADAERQLLRLAGEDVPPAVAAEALYLAGRAQYRQGRSGDGQSTFIALADRFPTQPATARGLFLLADLKHDDLAISDARRFYREAVEASPDLYEAGLALMRLGGIAYLDQDYQAAADLFEEYRARHPEGRRIEQATYWTALAYRQLGRDEDARARLRAVRQADPLSYYSVRAAEALGEPVLNVPMDTAPAPDPAVAARVEAELRRVDVLAELDRRTELVQEVERVRDRLRDARPESYALAEALDRRGFTLTGINIGWDLRRAEGDWNPRLLRIVYPLPFRDLLVPESRERGVDPYLVAGLIRRESAFSPTIVSSAGAVGLMQIMPGTGRELARATGVRDFRSDLLKEPEVNLHLGTRYLRDMLDRFDGRLPLVLSAYNAGPTRAERWSAFPEAGDLELLAERVPYSETRDYIRYVLLHRALYAALYPGLAGNPGDRGDPGNAGR